MNLWCTFLDRLVLLPSKPATADWLSQQYYRFQINHTEEQSHNLFLMLNFFSHCFLYRACMCLLCTSSCTTSCVGQLKQVTQLRWVDRMGLILCTREWDPPLWEATSANQLKISSVPWKRYTYRAYIVITLTHFSHFYLTKKSPFQASLLKIFCSPSWLLRSDDDFNSHSDHTSITVCGWVCQKCVEILHLNGRCGDDNHGLHDRVIICFEELLCQTTVKFSF